MEVNPSRNANRRSVETRSVGLELAADGGVEVRGGWMLDGVGGGRVCVDGRVGETGIAVGSAGVFIL